MSLNKHLALGLQHGLPLKKHIVWKLQSCNLEGTVIEENKVVQACSVLNVFSWKTKVQVIFFLHVCVCIAITSIKAFANSWLIRKTTV